MKVGEMNISKFSREIKYGLIIGVLTVLWLLIEFITGLHDKYIDLFLIVTNFVFLIPIVGIYLGIRNKRKYTNNNFLSFWKCFTVGLIISVVYSLVAGFGQFLYHQFINPEYFELMIDKSFNNGIDREQAQRFFNTSNYVLSVTFSYLIGGIIISLVVSLLIKKNPSKLLF